MNEAMRAQAARLRAMASRDAADWLVQQLPHSAEAITLLRQISLKREDECRLARHYLGGATHAADDAYRHFARRLGVTALIDILAQAAPRSRRDAQLLAYHLRTLDGSARDAAERNALAAFIKGLDAAYS